MIKVNNDLKQRSENTGQSKRLLEFRISKNFKSRVAFAHFINFSATTINEVEKGMREISPNLMGAIKKYFPDVDEEWLQHGSEQKLLTDENGDKIEALLSSMYEKDKLIKELKAILEDQKSFNENLKTIIKEQRELISQLKDLKR